MGDEKERALLDEAIEDGMAIMHGAVDDRDRTEALKAVATMMKVKHDNETSEKIAEKEAETKAKERILEYAKLGVSIGSTAAILIFEGIWLGKHMRFEETGTFTSFVGKNLMRDAVKIPRI